MRKHVRIVPSGSVAVNDDVIRRQVRKNEEKHEQRVAAFRQGITTSRDKDHGGDTHAMFAHLDDDESGHLSDEEMYTILGAPKGEEKKDAGPPPPPPPPLAASSAATPLPSGAGLVAGVYKIMSDLVEGMKLSMDTDGDGAVTKAEFHKLLHPEL